MTVSSHRYQICIKNHQNIQLRALYNSIGIVSSQSSLLCGPELDLNHNSAEQVNSQEQAALVWKLSPHPVGVIAPYTLFNRKNNCQITQTSTCLDISGP